MTDTMQLPAYKRRTNSVALSVVLYDETVARLAELAAARGVSRAEIQRHAILLGCAALEEGAGTNAEIDPTVPRRERGIALRPEYLEVVQAARAARRPEESISSVVREALLLGLGRLT